MKQQIKPSVLYSSLSNHPLVIQILHNACDSAPTKKEEKPTTTPNQQQATTKRRSPIKYRFADSVVLLPLHIEYDHG